MSARAHAEIHLGLATHGSGETGEYDALLAIAHLLVSIDDSVARLADGLTHGPAQHTHLPSPMLKADRYDPAGEGE